MKRIITLLLGCMLLSGAASAQFNVNTMVNKAKNAVSNAADKVVDKAKDIADDQEENVGKAQNMVVKGIQKAKQVMLKVDETTINGHKYSSLGDFNPEQYNRTATGYVTFTSVPEGYEEFDSVYTQLLGRSPQGAASMLVMAIDIYNHNAQLGDSCIKRVATPGCAQIVLDALARGLKPYQPTACLKGAMPENGYQPNTPYTVEFYASETETEKSGSNYVLYIDLNSKGWEQPRRTIAVTTASRGLYKVKNCDDLLMPCIEPQAAARK